MIYSLDGEMKKTNDDQLWPELPLAEWKDTYDTLHLWTQIIGRIRLELSPFINHWWNTTFYVTARGITTSSIHYNGKHFQIDFDFIAHLLKIETNDGSIKNLSLRPCSVTEFYHEIMSAMESLGMPITIWTIPVEVQERTPFEKDHKHASYNPEYTQRFGQILSQTSQVFTEFRCHFIGKSSPVHFFGIF
jgi:hypothetical protein